MTELELDVRLDGFPEPVGALVRDERGGLAFAYAPEYASSGDAIPLSLSLPLTDEPFGDVPTRAFFNNLLQERDDMLQSVMATHGLARDDIAGLLLHLGKDCAGALSVLAAGAPAAKVPGDYETDYDPISPMRMIEIVSALSDRERLPDGTVDPSPLAGVQTKIAMTVLPDGRFAFPKQGSGAPTTHILKVAGRRAANDARLEEACLRLSKRLGIDTADAEALEFGRVGALLVTRFDRRLDHKGRVIRRHQEDFAQALGLPAELKYERRGAPGRRFDTSGIRRILDQTLDPTAARIRFIKQSIFDLATGNCDSHAKNHAIFHLGAGKLDLAPRYDLLPTRLDPRFTEQLAFKIGDAEYPADVTRESFDGFLAELGVQNARAQRRIRRQSAMDVANCLAANLSELDANHMKVFADLIAGSMRALLTRLDVDVPEAFETRDAFVARGGGWLLDS